MAVICLRCGHHNADETTFCSNPACGAYLSWEGAAPSPAATAPPTSEDPALHSDKTAILTLSLAQLAVEPGMAADIVAHVGNRGRQVEQFAMSVQGPAAEWVLLIPPVLRIFPGEQAECVVRFNPPRSPSISAGSTPFTVRAVSTLHADRVAEADGILEIRVFRRLTAALIPQYAAGRGRTRHIVELTNAGNAGEVVSIQATDPTARFRFEAPVGNVPLPPGQHSVPLSVRPRATFWDTRNVNHSR